MGTELLPTFITEHYEVHEWKHACAILKNDFPQEWEDLIAVLSSFRLKKSWVSVGGGRKSKVSGWIDNFLYEKGWIEKDFATNAHGVDPPRGMKWRHGAD